MAFQTVLSALDVIVSIGCFLLGVSTVYVILSSAVRTFVVPRAQNAFLTRSVFISVSRLFNLYIGWRKIDTYEGRDRVLAYFAPVTVLILPLVWVTYIILGYMFIYWAMGVRGWDQAFTVSGSSFLTLGTTPFIALPITIVQFTEATLGLGMVALLISYLPTMYSQFSHREAAVEMLVVRAGSPPSAVEMITRIHRIRGLDYLHEMWETWEVWFTELEESHTSLSPLIWFRSPQPENSWLTAAGTIMDAAAIVTSSIAMPADPSAQLCIRAGFIALRRIEEFDAAYDELAAAGVSMKPDRDQCWLDYAGWRVNYDEVLLFLANITQAPYAPWISDRGRPITSRQFRSAYGVRRQQPADRAD